MKKQYVCDCPKGSRKYLKEGIFSITKTNSEGICLNCGHYATIKSDDRYGVNKYTDERLSFDDEWFGTK